MSSHPCQATRLRLHIGSRLYICPQESQKNEICEENFSSTAECCWVKNIGLPLVCLSFLPLHRGLQNNDLSQGISHCSLITPRNLVCRRGHVTSRCQGLFHPFPFSKGEALGRVWLNSVNFWILSVWWDRSVNCSSFTRAHWHPGSKAAPAIK